MQPLFCAQTPSSNGVCSSLRSGSSPCCVPAPDCSPAPLPAAARAHPRATIDTIASCPPTVAVDRRIADFMPPETTARCADVPALVGHDKGHCRPVGALGDHLVAHRAGEGPGQLTPRRGSPASKTPPTTASLRLTGNRQVGFAGDDLLHGVGGVADRRLDLHRGCAARSGPGSAAGGYRRR